MEVSEGMNKKEKEMFLNLGLKIWKCLLNIIIELRK
jgi:hypothetical protein